MNIVALVTGRGNNTLKDKNVLNVLGRPLMYYPCAAAKRSLLISDFYVSSDDEKILACGESLGFKRIERPAELATPTSQHVDAIRHALGRMRDAGCSPDILVVLLANNATVKTEWIDASIRTILNDETVSSVCPVEQD
jgi:CMP-N,N'-diacetyllegionaminic acid synthase